MTPLALLLLVRAEGESYGAAGRRGRGVRGRARRSARPSAGGRSTATARPACSGSARSLFGCSSRSSSRSRSRTRASSRSRSQRRSPGSSMPPLSSTVRVVWPRLAPDELRSTAYALEAALQEVHLRRRARCSPPRSPRSSPSPPVAGTGVASLVGTTGRAAPAGPRDAAVAHRRRRAARRARVARRADGRRSTPRRRDWRSVSVELTMPAFAEEPRRARARWPRARVRSPPGASSAGSLPARCPPRERSLRRFVAGVVRARPLRLLALPARRVDPDALRPRVRRRAPDRPDGRRAVRAHRPLGAAGTIAESFAWFGTAVSLGHRGRLGDRRRARRRARGSAGRSRPDRSSRLIGGAVVAAAASLGAGAGAGTVRPTDTGRRRARVYPASHAPVAQGTERRTSNPRVGGSNPPGRIGRRARRGRGDGERHRRATPRAAARASSSRSTAAASGHDGSRPRPVSRTSGPGDARPPADIVLSSCRPASAVAVAEAIADREPATHGRSSPTSTRSRPRPRARSPSRSPRRARDRRRLDLGRAARRPGHDAHLPLRAARRGGRGPAAPGVERVVVGDEVGARVRDQDVHRVGLQGPGRAARAGASHRPRERRARARPRRSRRHRARRPSSAHGRDARERVGQGVALRAPRWRRSPRRRRRPG